MKATFATSEPNILMEAKPGDLFTPLGPRLVECVCAVCSVQDQPGAALRISDVFPPHDLDPEIRRPVIVLACRVEKGEPEYHPPGFKCYLHGSTPIAFLEQVEPLALRPRDAAAASDAASAVLATLTQFARAALNAVP